MEAILLGTLELQSTPRRKPRFSFPGTQGMTLAEVSYNTKISGVPLLLSLPARIEGSNIYVVLGGPGFGNNPSHLLLDPIVSTHAC